jgi:hypothetical protein
MPQSKLFYQFNKLLDHSTFDMDDDKKMTHKLVLKMTKQLKLDDEE